MSSNPQPRVWTKDDPEPPMIPDPPRMYDRYGVAWKADQRWHDGFDGWRVDSHGLTGWRTWAQLTYERGPLTDQPVTQQASSAERPEEDVLHRIRQVLHDNNLGCADQPGKHDKVARQILEEVCRCAPTPSADSTPVVSYDSLVGWVTRLEVTVKPVNGVVTIVAESMADRFVEFLGANGIEVRRDGL